MDASTDGELARAASGGDVAALGLLLERHRADMKAVAVARLGFGPAAEDAVQDAMVSAMTSLGSLRDPNAVGSWLRAIVRNACRGRLRAAPHEVPLDFDVVSEHTVEGVLDRHALRDWVWHAIGELSEPLQVVVILRHFGGGHSYAEIAQICGVPIGTVRSRLNQARRLLAGSILTQADAAHADSLALVQQRAAGLRRLLTTAEDGPGLPATVADLADPDVVVSGWWGRAPHARDVLVQILRGDAEDGVRERVVDVVASTRFTVMECDLISPPWDPTHCPPSVLWLVRMHGERMGEVRLYHPVPA